MTDVIPSVKSTVNFDEWIEEYKKKRLEDSKQSELSELVRIFKYLNDGNIM